MSYYSKAIVVNGPIYASYRTLLSFLEMLRPARLVGFYRKVSGFMVKSDDVGLKFFLQARVSCAVYVAIDAVASQGTKPWHWASHFGFVPCANYPYRWAWEARKWLTEVLVKHRSLRSPLMRLLCSRSVVTHPSGCQSVSQSVSESVMDKGVELRVEGFRVCRAWRPTLNIFSRCSRHRASTLLGGSGDLVSR